MQKLQELTPLFDIVRQYHPSFSEELARKNPRLARVASGSRILGRDDSLGEQGDVELYLEIAGKAADGVRAHIDAIEAEIDRKIRMFGRIRLVVGALTTLAAAVVLGAIFSKNQALGIGSAIIAFLSSILALFSSYIESFSSGDGSMARAKEDRILIIEKFAQANSAYLVAKALRQAERALESLGLFNDVAGKCLIAGARVGVRLNQIFPAER